MFNDHIRLFARDVECILNSLTILVVDDEQGIRDMVSMAMELAGFRCIKAESALEAIELIHDQKPDLLITDWMMPEVTGVELVRRLKRDGILQDVPTIMLTAKVEEDSAITGLESGADDYITKPFSPRELVARAKSLLRRQGKLDADAKLLIGGLELDTASHRVQINGKPIKLGPIEYRLLYFFVKHSDRVYSREQLLDRVWGTNVYVEERTVDVHIRRLRKALTVDGFEKRVETIRGAGYLFNSSLELEANT